MQTSGYPVYWEECSSWSAVSLSGQKLSVPISSSIEYVLGATVTFSLFYAESNFALMVGGVLTTYLALLILLRLLTLSSTPAVPDAGG